LSKKYDDGLGTIICRLPGDGYRPELPCPENSPTGLAIAKIADAERLAKMLTDRAGLSTEMIQRGVPDEQFENICNALKQIHRGKEVLYGNYLETHGGDPTNFALMEHFADFKRKYVRAEIYIKKRLEGDVHDLSQLLDTYSDAAVYALMGIQMCLKFISERGEK